MLHKKHIIKHALIASIDNNNKLLISTNYIVYSYSGIVDTFNNVAAQDRDNDCNDNIISKNITI